MLWAASVASAAPVWSQSEPFYRGKTLRFVVGSATANFYAAKNAEIAKDGFEISLVRMQNG